MKLISETLDSHVEHLVEEKNGRRVVYVEGIAAQADVPNRNGRRYPPPVLEREIARYMKEKITTGEALGELGHPDGPGINLDRVSHIFRSVKREGNNWIARAELVDTDPGRTAAGLIQAGARIGFSTRGLGTLKREESSGHQIVQDDYRLACLADLVASPSAPDAYVKGIMESVEWFVSEKTGEWVQRQVEADRATVKSMSKGELHSDKLVKMFESFIARLAHPDESQSLVKKLAKSANVSESRVRELWESHRDVAVVKRKLGLEKKDG